jgi:hypothetical protein
MTRIQGAAVRLDARCVRDVGEAKLFHDILGARPQK